MSSKIGKIRVNEKTRKKGKFPGKHAVHAHAMCVSFKKWQKIPHY
jgi:hypothetical protein